MDAHKPLIRIETEEDYQQVFQLIEKAFLKEEYSDHQEQYLVERLRSSDAFVPELSLVACLDGKVVGYILFSKIKIKSQEATHGSLALAPVAVLPEHQKQGLGAILIQEGHKRAKALGYSSVILLGHADYYPKFGYKKAEVFGIQLPFDVPPENCMAIELTEGGLRGVSGLVEYPKEFFE